MIDDLELTAVPAPAAAWLFGTGVIALLGAQGEPLNKRQVQDQP